MKRLLLYCSLLFIFNATQAQSWKTLDQNDEVEVKYKWKENKSGETELRLKFKNKTKSDVMVDYELGFYDTGVLEQRSNVVLCMKSGFLNNWFRDWHIIQAEEELKDKALDEFEIESIEITSSKVKFCEETEP